MSKASNDRTIHEREVKRLVQLVRAREARAADARERLAAARRRLDRAA